MKKKASLLTSYIQLSSAMIIVGSSIVVGKILTNSFPVFLASFLGLFFASIVFLVMPFFSKYQIEIPHKKEFSAIFLQALLGTFLYRILLLYGLKQMSASYAGIISSTLPATIAILSVIFLKEKISKNVIFGIIAAVLGVLLISIIGINNGEFITLVGVLLVFASVVGESMFNVIAKQLTTSSTPYTIASMVTFVSTIMFLPLAFFQALCFDFSVPGLTDWISIGYYGLFVTVIAFLLWFKGLQKVDSAISGIFMSLVPITSLLLSALLLGDKITPIHLIGSLLVLIAIFSVEGKNIICQNKKK